MSIADWNDAKAAAFGRGVVPLSHSLHERPLFSDEGLASILDRYPRERLGVFTMGEDLEDWRSWRRGSAGALSGEALLKSVQSGRLWLNLRDTNQFLPEFAALCDEIAAEKERWLGVPILKRDLGLLISSPDALVFYHLDVPFSSLWQIRGHKRIWFYPRREPFVSDEQIEAFVLQEAEGQFPFNPEWDASADVYDMAPGQAFTWPQNAPHRVRNGPMMNVSLSMEFMTPDGLLRANVLYANGLLRRRLGLRPKVQSRLGPAAAGKVLLARAAKAASQRRRTYRPIMPATFALDPARPGVLQAAG